LETLLTILYCLCQKQLPSHLFLKGLKYSREKASLGSFGLKGILSSSSETKYPSSPTFFEG